MQANKEYFIMINNEAEYNQAVKMLQNMGFKLPSDMMYFCKKGIVYSYSEDDKTISYTSDTKETYKREFPDDIELFLNNESKEMTITKHNINIADYPDLYNAIVLTRTQEEWNDVIQYDPHYSQLSSKEFDNYQENSVIACKSHAFTYSNLDWIKGAEDWYKVMYHSQWKALLERLAAEQKENDKCLFANKELKQFKDLADSEKLIIVNALISDCSKVEYYSKTHNQWNIKHCGDLGLDTAYRVLK